VSHHASRGLAICASWRPHEVARSASFKSRIVQNGPFRDGLWLALTRRMTMQPALHLLHRELTDKIIRGFYDTYNELGPGFPEYVCISALTATLQDMRIEVVAEPHVPVYFRGRRIAQFRPDIVVAGVVIVEVKVAAGFERFHLSQVKHYLKATGLSVGLLVNFGREPAFERIVFETARTRHTTPEIGGGSATKEPPLDDGTRAPGTT
jgi:GxxExxY protein